MLRITAVSLVCFFIKISLFAQVCGTPGNVPPGCLLDTIYQNGTTNGFSTSPAGSSINGKFCTSVNNDIWYEFIPLCEEVNIKFRSIACVPRIATYGIGVAVMDENFEVLPFCFVFPAIGFGSRNLNVKDLTPGKRYTLMLYTAVAGQRCTYNFEITGISTFGLDSPAIHGEFNIGAGSVTKYYVDREEQGTTYKWTAPPGLNIISPDNSHEVMVDAPTAGTYLLCCEITSPSGAISNICKNVNVGNNSTIINYEQILFCQGECHDFYGDCLNVPGHYYQPNGNTLHVLELCQNPEPQVGIYGAPEIVSPSEFAPVVLNGYLERGFGTDYTYQWLDSGGRPINNSNSIQLSADRSGTYCFIARNNITGCADTTCINLLLTDPLPEPCGVAGDDPPGCALCGAVYTGSTAGYSRGIRPPGFCGTIENNQWLAFQANSTTATVSITSWDCLFGRGVQLYMVDTDGNPVSSCFSSGGNNLPGNISATGLTPGQVYYIMIDGFAGDICDFSINLIGGINTGPPDTPGVIESDLDDPCPGQIVCYSVEPVQNASNYEWFVTGDGQIIVGQGSEEVCIQWGSSGLGEVCVAPLNPCFYGDTVCLQVDVVASSAVNDLPPMSFCENEFPLDPSVYCMPGQACPGIIPSEGKFCVNVGPSSTTCDSTVCFTFNAIPINRTVIDTFFCEGDCLFWDNMQICEPDTLEIPMSTGTSCDDILELRVREIKLEAVINNPRPYDCITGDTMWLEAINSTTGPGITYQWEGFDGGVVEDGEDRLIAVIRGAGRYILTVKFGEGFDACFARDTVLVEGSLVPPIISCTSDGSSITFTWAPVPGAVNYNVDIDGVPQGITTMTTYTVSGLAPLQDVTIGVQANGIPGCGSSTSTAQCRAQDCPPISLSVDSVPSICLGINDQPIQLTFQTPGGTGAGTANWVSPGISPTGVFDPKIVGPGIHNLDLIYSEAGCNHIATRQVIVYDKPIATFDAVSPICVTDDSEINYTGNASSNADFQWDFDGGTPNGVPGASTFFVEWNAGGTFDVSLQVTENGCASDIETQQVNVVEPLPKPDLICAGATTSSVDITWADVPGATVYDVLVLLGRAGIRTGNSYRVTDMNPGEEITLVISASGNNICGPSLDTITCRAQDCPPIQVNIGAIPSVCLYDNVQDFDLSNFLILTGNTSSATVEWSSTTGSVSPQGIFSPLNSGIGIFDVRVDIEDQGCAFFAEAQVEMSQVPDVDFTAPAEICITETAEVESVGSTLPGTNYFWDFGNGASNNGTSGQGVFDISYPSSGDEMISFWAEANGCYSDTLVKMIRITEPLPTFIINCTPTTNSIDFSWNPTPGATDYLTQILSAPATSVNNQPDNFSINFSNLNPLDEVTIQVQISDNTSSCPPTVVEKTCEAMDCPPIEIETLSLNQICLEVGEIGLPIDLNDYIILTGDRGNAVRVWSGSTISPQGIFQPNSTDFGTHQFAVEVTEEGCSFTALLSIDVFKTPDPRFMAESPICLNDFSTLDLLTTPDFGTEMFWNFGNSVSQVGNSDTGPLQLTWDIVQTDQVWLYAEKDNCISDTIFEEIIIEPEMIAPTIRCNSELTQILFEWDDVPPATEYEVTVNDIPASAVISRPDDLSFLVESLFPSEEVTITVAASNPLSVCPPVSTTFTCEALPCPNMDISLPNLPDICLHEGIEPIDLSSFVIISGELQNGAHSWAGAGITPTGTFDPTAAGIGTHLMVFSYTELKCEYRENVEITIHPVPVADAGVDQFLSCLDFVADIGGIRNASNPAAVRYEWFGGQVDNATIPNTQTTEVGNYILNALNTETGCSNSDTVIVNQGPEAPILEASILDISCFGYHDGIIKVDTVLGGTPQFLFSLNDGPFLPNSEFQELGPGDYRVRVRDAFGCEDEVTFSISEPDELSVELVIVADEIPVPFGDSIRLDAITNYAPEFLSNIQWSPVEEFLPCDETNITNCLSVFVTPNGQTVYTVRVEHVNGCIADDRGQVLVSKERGIYIPSAFSPNNNDGINDVFRIFADLKNLKNIRSFLVFDRWGELVHEHYNFLPEDETHGWDGRLRGKKMSPNVFVYMAEVEFFDGSVELFKGDVTLTR